MNTYTLTEIELTELLRKQRVLCAEEVFSTIDESKERVLNAPLPHLPSGAKKEDIQPVLADEKSLGEAWNNEDDEKWEKLSQKQSLIELMEADQRDGIYGVREKERLYAFAKFMNQWQSENEQWNERELRNIINDFVAQNTTKEPVIDNLEKDFYETFVNKFGGFNKHASPKVIIKWLSNYLKSNSEPVIDWEGLGASFYKEYVNRDKNSYGLVSIFNWLKSNLSNYYKVNQH